MSAMLELYHHGSSVCAAKVRFALAEKGLEWQGHYIDILKGDQFDPAYIRLNAGGGSHACLRRSPHRRVDGDLRVYRRRVLLPAAEARRSAPPAMPRIYPL